MAFLLLHLPVLILNSTATFVYPLYASYKAITSPSRAGSSVSSYSWRTRHDPMAIVGDPASPSASSTTEMAELETWLMYWSVIACIQTAETFLEWSWSWIPFYFEFKLLFTLWLVLPQTRGATYLYINHVAPFLAEHEQDIDVALTAAKSKVKAMAADWLVRAWNQLRDAIFAIALSQPVGQSQQSTAPSTSDTKKGARRGTAGSTPSNNDSKQQQKQQQQQEAAANAEGIAKQLFGFLRSYAPAVAASANAIVEKATQGAKEPPQAAATRAAASKTSREARKRGAAATAAAGGASTTAMNSIGKGPAPQDRAAAARRRAELERQLAQLDMQERRATSSNPTGPKPRAASSAVRSSAAASARAGGSGAGTAGRRRMASQPILAARGTGADGTSTPSSEGAYDDDDDAAGGDAEDEEGGTFAPGSIPGANWTTAEKQSLSGSYAMLDKADAQPPVAPTAAPGATLTRSGARRG